MRKTLGPLLLLALLLAGCGGDGGGDGDGDGGGDGGGDEATDAAPATDSTTGTVGTGAEPVVLALVNETNAGGAVSDRLMSIEGSGMFDFLSQFDSSSLSEQVMALAEENVPAEGRELTAAVVAIGCDVPPGVSVAAGEEGWTVSPDRATASLQQCVEPVTTVAVVEVPSQD